MGLGGQVTCRLFWGTQPPSRVLLGLMGMAGMVGDAQVGEVPATLWGPLGVSLGAPGDPLGGLHFPVLTHPACLV